VESLVVIRTCGHTELEARGVSATYCSLRFDPDLRAIRPANSSLRSGARTLGTAREAASLQKSPDLNGILDNGIRVRVRERDDRLARGRRDKSKALSGTSGNERAHIRHISESHHRRRHSRRTRVFSRSDCLECHTELTAGGNCESATGASNNRNPDWIAATARHEEGDGNDWNSNSPSAPSLRT
jgi:hypothetical protein